ncbi:DinB superfamily protein [Pseudobythopirellula maris]|uniref:DinB superfamily protein n=1 Tax=Pseudobythopirellula maris TaxID=2527991 RepID=A0A5C5ZT27_9BACT|nr:DinB family protein [Pseudobythopirellula maris]TWT90175.1 DinB superfamily protein [Pseudobythopirellula maris]
MNVNEAIQTAAGLSNMVLNAYLGDLDDADLMRRPAPGCNHLAWQLGHLITAEKHMIDTIQPGAAPELPEGFADQYSRETCGDDDPSHFCTKQEYVDLFTQMRKASSDMVAGLSPERFDEETPDENFRRIVPTIGAMCLLLANHPMMHAGQFVPVRRVLGKPTAI